MNNYERMKKYKQTCRETKYFHIGGKLCKITAFSHFEDSYKHPDDITDMYWQMCFTQHKTYVKYYYVGKRENCIRKAFVNIPNECIETMNYDFVKNELWSMVV